MKYLKGFSGLIMIVLVLCISASGQSQIEFGLWGVPLDKLEEVYENGVRHVRTAYGLSGVWHHGNDTPSGDWWYDKHRLLVYIDSAIAVGMKTIVIQPDERLIFYTNINECWGKYTWLRYIKENDPDWGPTIRNHRWEMSEFIKRVKSVRDRANIKKHKNNKEDYARVVIYLDEPYDGNKIKQKQVRDTPHHHYKDTTANIHDLIAIARSGKKLANEAGMEWWIASTSGPNKKDKEGFPQWYHKYNDVDKDNYADRLLLTQFSIGFDYDAKDKYATNFIDTKRVWYNREIEQSVYTRSMVSPMVAAHNFNHSVFHTPETIGWANDDYFPSIHEMVSYILLASQYDKLVWIYIAAHDSGDTTTTQWNLPIGNPQINKVYKAMADARSISRNLPIDIDVQGAEYMGSHPLSYSLSDNYPNPFNPATTIRFNVPKPSRVSLIIYDIMGREVRRLVEGVIDPGYYNETWDGTNFAGNPVSSGIYIYRFTAIPLSDSGDTGGVSYVKKMLFTK